MASVVLLPGSLPHDQATLRALTEGLPSHQGIAARLHDVEVTGIDGSWSDAERAASGNRADLRGGRLLRAAIDPNTASRTATTFAVASPLSAALGLTDLTTLDPDTLQLTDADSRALCSTCDEHLRGDGIQLTFADTHQWLLASNQQIDAMAERPDWLIGENLRPHLPRGRDARIVERWMNELQMLLYTHPVNIARQDRGLPPINVIWLWGFSPATAAGGRSADPLAHSNGIAIPATTGTTAAGSGTSVIFDFAKAFRRGDLAGWQQAWSAHAETILATHEIILGDAHPLLKVTPRQPGFVRSVLARFTRPPTLADALTTLRSRVAAP